MIDLQGMKRRYHNSDNAFIVPYETRRLELKVCSMSRRTEFGKRLVQARKTVGWSQKELAARVGIAQSSLSSSETIHESSTHTVQLARALGVNPEWLATGKGAREGSWSPLPAGEVIQRPAAAPRPLDLSDYLSSSPDNDDDAQPPDKQSAMARELSALFDLVTSRVDRARAYSAATQAILDVLNHPGATPEHKPEPDDQPDH